MDQHGCDIGLSLRLGSALVDSLTIKQLNVKMAETMKPSFELPLLSLSFIHDGQLEQGTVKGGKGQGTVDSSFSSSGAIVKRERLDEEEDYNCFSNNGAVRKKLRLKKDQTMVLEESFKQQSNLNPKQKQTLAGQLNLSPKQVEVWFQNKRARTKLKQTELDYEYLKKCCEILTEENRRLVKELKLLKILRHAESEFPVATLTICPSCEGVSSTPAHGGDRASKPKIFNITPSAAC